MFWPGRVKNAVSERSDFPIVSLQNKSWALSTTGRHLSH